MSCVPVYRGTCASINLTAESVRSLFSSISLCCVCVCTSVCVCCYACAGAGTAVYVTPQTWVAALLATAIEAVRHTTACPTPTTTLLLPPPQLLYLSHHYHCHRLLHSGSVCTCSRFLMDLEDLMHDQQESPISDSQQTPSPPTQGSRHEREVRLTFHHHFLFHCHLQLLLAFTA